MKQRLLELFEAVWPGMPKAITAAKRWGADWFEVSTPFVVEVGGRAVAHTGVIEMPLRVDGRDISVAGVHAVCAHPDFRGQGYARQAIERALEHVDARYATALLWSEKTELYERFGFVTRHESIFVAQPALRTEPAARRLDIERDHELVRRLLAARTPVSDRFSTREPGWHFLIDLALWPSAQKMLFHLPNLDALVVAEILDDAIRIYDVVATQLPPAARIAGALGGAGRIELFVTPDRLAPGASAAPNPLEDVLMVRGAWSAPPEVALSALCRC